MKEIIKIEKCEVKEGKSGKNYHKVNGNLFVFDKDMGRKFEDNIGKSFEVETDRSTDFHKIKEIYGETDKAPEVVRPADPVDVAKEIVKQEEPVLIIKDKPNSRTIGKGHDQIKIYFNTPAELDAEIKSLEQFALMPKDWDNEPEFK